MAKEDIKKMIDNLEAGDNVGASDAFNAYDRPSKGCD